MARFFIDTHDGRSLTRDDEGETFRSLDEARDATLVHLPGVVDVSRPDAGRQMHRAILRNEAGSVVYVATLAFDEEWSGRRS